MWIDFNTLVLLFLVAFLGAFLIGYVNGAQRSERLQARNEELLMQLAEMQKQAGVASGQGGGWVIFLLVILGLALVVLLLAF